MVVVTVAEKKPRSFAKTSSDVNMSCGGKRRKMCEISMEVVVAGMGNTVEDIAAASIVDSAGHLGDHDMVVGRTAAVEAAGTTQAPS